MTLETVTSLAHRRHIGIALRRPSTIPAPCLWVRGPLLARLFWFESHFVENLPPRILNPCLAPHFALIL
jgi:hypothetical protein